MTLQLKVRGLDCAEEVAILKREVGPIVGGEQHLTFDILRARMTVAGPADIAIGRVLDGMATGRTPPQLWRDTRVWGGSHQSLMQVNCRRFTKEQVEAALAHAAKTDRMVKGLIRGDVWDELLQLGLRFAK